MNNFFPRFRQTGFSLIEILVALLIGMIGIIVMMQVFSLSEERKRTTSAGGEAQNNAVIALDGMQRDIGQSGYGFALTRLLNCSLQLRAGVVVTLAPVMINPPISVVAAGDVNTDTLLVAYGSAADQPEGYSVTNNSGSSYVLTRTGLLSAGDRVFVAPATSACGTLILDSIQTTNPASATVVLAGSSVAGSALFSLGAAPQIRAYAVRNGALAVCDYMANDCSQATAANWQTISDNIVSLRAQYGRDTGAPMDGIVDVYDQTTGTTACGWARTSAVRLVLVARSAQYERDEVTAVAPAWLGSADTAIDLSGYAEWKHYRYKVFQTVVPIRNIAWMGVPTGC